MSGNRTIYRAEQLPVFQNRMFNTAASARACVRGDIDLVQDSTTGLVFNRAFDPALMIYDVDYQNEQGHSAVFRQHLDAVAQVVQKHFAGQTLIEVGCGKGLFLEQLQALGFRITGLDPTYEGTNPSVIREYFTPSTGLRADALVLRHVLEHVTDPLAFLQRLRDSNGGQGKIYIEVPCLDWIATNRAWFDLFYEHVNYFRLGDFARLFGTIHEAGHTFGGQYLYAVADLATLRAPVATAQDSFDFPIDFVHGVTHSAARLKIAKAEPAGRKRAPAAIWGGASKGVIFALFMERAGAPVDLVIDINPAKQGRFLAATGLCVFAPQSALALLPPGTDLFVMNRNYLNEIQVQTRHQFNYITPDHEII